MINFSVKPVLFKNRKSPDGIYRIAIRVTINRKRTYEVTGFSCHEDEWDGKTKDKVINRAIGQMVAEKERIISEQISSGKKISVESIREPEKQTFEHFCKQQIKKLSTNKEASTIRDYEKQLKKFWEFHQGTAKSITPKVLNDFKHELEKTLHHNTVWACFKTVKKFYRIAVNEGLADGNPFEKMESKPKYKEPDTEYLTIEELNKLEKLELDGLLKTVRDYFLLECYSGLRFSDWSRFEIERINKVNNLKVGAQKNGEPIYLPIDSSPRLKRIIDTIERPYPIGMHYTNILLKAIQQLAGIKKNLRTHIGRHTFGVLCAELGLSIETTAELMGITMNVCKTYYKVTRQKVYKEFQVWNTLK